MKSTLRADCKSEVSTNEIYIPKSGPTEINPHHIASRQIELFEHAAIAPAEHAQLASVACVLRNH
jgi:DNA-binding ferritin-like protein (Dps family)